MEGEKCAGRHAAAAYLRLSHHLHRRWGFNPASFAIYNPPWARSAGFSCAAACNGRVAINPAFARHRFDLPLPSKVLHAHAAVAALAVQHTAVQPLLLRRFQYPVDGSSMGTCGAADDQGSSARVVVGNGSRLGGGMLSALRKNKDKSEEAVRRWRGGGRAGGSSQPDAPLQHQPPSSQAARLYAFCCRKKPSMCAKCRLQLRSRLQRTPCN